MNISTGLLLFFIILAVAAFFVMSEFVSGSDFVYIHVEAPDRKSVV